MRTRFRKTIPQRVATASDEEQLYQEHVDDQQRCLARLTISESTVDLMVSEFLASHGSVTVCPTAYAILSPQYRV